MYWGRIIGALIGLLIGGPIGVLIGMFAGAVFDRGYEEQYKIQHARQRFIQQVYFKVSFQVMGHIAKADGRISEDEIYSARSVMRRMNLSDQQVIEAIHYFNQGKEPDFNFHAALSELFSACHTHPMLLQMFVEMQFQAAMPGKMGAAKQRLLHEMCDDLGVAPLFGAFRDPSWQRSGHRRKRTEDGGQHKAPREKKRTLDDEYRLLGIAATATDAEVKKAYRKMMSQNHPDKLVSQGLPEEMIKLANEKTQKIVAAYEKVMQSRGK